LKLAGKKAVVTGAGRGIGKAIALDLAAEGADIALVARTLLELESVRAEIQRQTRRAIVSTCDVTDHFQVENTMRRILEEFGREDILVNCAGVSTVAKVVEMSEEEWDLNLDVNAKGTFLCSKYVAQQMIKQGGGGKIVNIASRAGRVGVAGLAHYSASKFAVIGFTESLAIELAPHLINVNAICPGRIETEMTSKEIAQIAKKAGVTEEQSRTEYFSAIPWPRPGRPEDVSRAVVFLSSSDSDYITGAAITVTGGLDLVRGGNG